MYEAARDRDLIGSLIVAGHGNGNIQRRTLSYVQRKANTFMHGFVGEARRVRERMMMDAAESSRRE